MEERDALLRQRTEWNGRQQKTITSYLLPWLQGALGFQEARLSLSHQEGFDLFSVQSRTSTGVLEMWGVGPPVLPSSASSS